MKVAVRKFQPEDATKLQTLVAVNIDNFEPGLVVLDSRLLIGHATIDVVAVDANNSLVLIATGLTANEEMLMRAVEAYTWCREYPESVQRLYPRCVISDAQPPRLIFVVERMPDAFHRKVKQLGFPEVDCVELRVLEVNGAPAVCFESIAKLNRPPAAPHVNWQQPEPVLVPGPMIMTPEPEIAMPAPVVVAPDPVIVAPEPIVLPQAMVEAEAVMDALAELEPEAAAPDFADEPEPPFMPEETWVADLESEGILLPEALETVTEPAAAEEIHEPDAIEVALRESDLASPEPNPTLTSVSADWQEARVSLKDLAGALLGPTAAPVAPRVEHELREVEDAPAADAEAEAAIELVPAMAEAELEPAFAVDALLESMTPAAKPAVAAAVEPRAVETAKPAAALPREFKGLTFPNDSVLTRQWAEFLSQMATK